MIMVGVVFEKKYIDKYPFQQLKQLTSKLYTKCYTTVDNTVVLLNPSMTLAYSMPLSLLS